MKSRHRVSIDVGTIAQSMRAMRALHYEPATSIKRNCALIVNVHVELNPQKTGPVVSPVKQPPHHLRADSLTLPVLSDADTETRGMTPAQQEAVAVNAGAANHFACVDRKQMQAILLFDLLLE